jgi:hypothetical protein
LLACNGCDSRPQLETVAGGPRSTVRADAAKSAPAPASDEKEIRALFDRFWDKVTKRDGEGAVACVDKKTIDWYEGIRKDALTLTKDALQKQDLVRRLWILKFRHDFDRPALAKMSGRDAYARGVALGWLDGPAKAKLRLAYVGSNGNSAHGIFAGAPELPSFFFEKEPDGWKVNETRLLEYAQGRLKDAARASGLEETRFLLNNLASESTRKIDERILDGPLDKLSS